MEQTSEKKLLNLIRMGPLFIILVSVIVIYIIINNHNRHIDSQIEEAKQQSIIDKKTIVKREVQSVHDYIESELKRAKLTIKNDIRNRVNEAISIANSIYVNNRDKDDKLIQKLIFDALRDIRFNDSRGYFFIYENNARNVMHPILKNLEGTSLWDFQDKKGLYVTRELKKISEEQGEGYLTWWWSKPDDLKNNYEKIGFIKAFKPYGWYIGTGEYVVDYENALKKELLKRIQKIRFGKNGYVFIVDKEGVYLSHVKKENIGLNRINLQDKNGVMITKEVIKTAQKGEGYISYVGTIQPTTGKPAEKISFIKGFEKWQWAIGAGVYLDEIDAQIKEKSSLIKQGDNSQFNKILLISFFVFVFLFIISFYLAKITKNKFLEYNNKTKEKTKELALLNNTLEQKIEERTKEVLDRNNDLLEQKNLFETLVNSIPDIVWMKDKNGVYLQCNHRFTEFFGATQEEIVGKTDYDFVEEKLANLFRTQDENAMKSDELNINFEIIPFASDGHEEYTQTIKKVIKNDDGSILGVLGIGRDFTKEHAQKEELKEAIKNLKVTQDKLIEAEKMSSLGILVAGIAHEINTPVGIGLTGATHFLEMTDKLKEDYDNQDMSQDKFEKYLTTSREIASLINTNLDRTAQLVKNFKSISFDQSSEEIRKINLKSYIEDIHFSMSSIIKKTNIVVENNCDNDINILTFPGAISQVITNLILNSVRHGFEENEDGIITIAATTQENIVRLVYKDNGKGIDEESLPKIFDPFFTTNRESGGTGLGLNIIYNIVSNTLHGTIECKSKKNEGVEFIILFQENENTSKVEKEVLWQI